MDDAIYISDYVKSDPRESRLHNAKEERRLKMEEHRGVTYTNAGKAYVNEMKGYLQTIFSGIG